MQKQAEKEEIFSRVPIPGRQDIPRRSTANKAPIKTIQYETQPDQDQDQQAIRVTVRHKGRFPWAVLVLVTFIIGWLVLSFVQAVVIPWAQGIQDQWDYGKTRINYQQIIIQGSKRDVLTMGYKGDIVVILLATKDQQASEYISPQFYGDAQSRVLTVTLQDANHDGIPDMIIGGGSSVVSAVLYGNKKGGFTWQLPN